jgi:penicillin-binding protein 1A
LLGFCVHIINKLLKIFLALALLGILTVAITYAYLRPDFPDVDALKDVQLQTPMKIYTKEGLLISQYGEKRRIPLALDQIPKNLIHAVLDTEDSRFYKHPGIDLIGIMRAATNMLLTGSRKQGASTITMQVARNFFLTRERTFNRKIKELFIALHIESVLTKDEILTLYLNKIALGHRAFGVGAAAQVYYGKPLEQLSLAELATIAGLPKAPSTMNPISRPKRAVARRGVVLGRMLTMEHITKAQYHEAKMAPVTAKKHGADIAAHAPYVASLVNKEMIERYGEEAAYTQGYQVYTTVTAKLQFAAQQAIINNLHTYDERHGYRGPKQYLWTPPVEEENADISEIGKTDDNIDNDTVKKADEKTKALQLPPNWSKNQISEQLSRITTYGELVPAVVISTEEKTAQVQLKSGSVVSLTWDNIKWAKPFINDRKTGRPPKLVTDIFTAGAQIWVRPTDDGSYRLAQVPAPSGALVALNPTDGAIKSLVGGYSYSLSQYNRATQAKRQVGSNIKPFIYSAALENGHTLASLINDAPIHQWDKNLGVAWRPKNSPPYYDGPTRIRVALAKSKNVVSVRLLKGIGINNAIDHIEKFGISRTDLPPNDTLALGSASLTPLQVAAGTATFANGGFLVKPYIIDRIEDASGKIIFQAKPAIACPVCVELEANAVGSRLSDNYAGELAVDDTPEIIRAPQVISSQNAFLISQAMTSTIWGGGSWKNKTGWNGTAWRAQKFGRHDLSGKTGTTNDSRDTWFSGFNNQLMVTSWVGFDNPSRALGRSASGVEAGALTALPAWMAFMDTALADVQEQPPLIPHDIVSVRIDQKTGLLATKNDFSSRFEYFIRGTQPREYATGEAVPVVFDNDGEGKISDEEEIF